MRKLIILGATLSALAIPTTSMAHSDAIIGAAIGGATGAAIGGSMGGRDNIIIWSAIGSAAGAAIGHDMYEREVVVVRDEMPVRHIVREQPVYQRVYYTEEPGYWRHRKHHHHHHDDDYDD